MGDIWTMLYQHKNEAHLSLQGKELAFVSRQMESLLPFFHNKRFSIHSKKPTQKSNQPLLTKLKKVPKGARGKLWKSIVMQPFCLCGSERLGWRIVLFISIFPNGLDRAGIGSSLLQTIFLASQSWISRRYQWKESEWISWNVCHFGDVSY